MSGATLPGELEVTLNGDPRQVIAGTTLDTLVTSLGSGALGVAVAINEDLVPRSNWAATTLARHDRIEVLVPTQGG